MTNMKYIDRDKDGNITGAFVREQYEGQEQLPEDNPELQVFINRGMIDPNEEKIQTEIIELNRIAAIESLKIKGELPADYEDSKIEK